MWRCALVLAALIGVSISQGQSPAKGVPQGPNLGPWWSNAVYYRILVDSFKDSDGDGLGDLKGVSKQLSYVRALGADAVILSPIVVKSTDCSKPGVVDFGNIDPRYGNIEDFNGLIDKANKLELKTVITLPIQTTSLASEWFNSSADKTVGYEDRIVWMEGTAGETPQAPAENGITWNWHEGRSAYWAAKNNEAVLNFCSEGVIATLTSAACAWARRGVSGVLLNPDFPQDQQCGVQLLRKLAAETIRCARAANFELPAILAETALKPEQAADYYSDGGLGAHSVISAAFTSSTRNPPELALAFYAAMLTAPQDKLPSWMTSTLSESRTATRYGTELVDAVNLLALTLPGAVIIQQGDELGAADTLLEWATTSNCWPGSILPSSAPFPWDDSSNGGFTTGEPWLPLAPNYRYANAKTEFANDLSHVGVVRVAAAMRKSPAIGPHADIKRLGDAITILRWGGSGSLLVVSNMGKDQTEAQLSRIPGLPSEMTVASSSGGSSLATGTHHSTEKTLKLAPGETILFAGPPRHCGGPGPVDRIATKLSEGWQKLNKYFSNM